MPERLWKIVIEMNIQSNALNIALTTSEVSVLTTLRADYSIFESQIKEIGLTSRVKPQAGLVEDVLILLRCLVFNRLEVHDGQFVNIQQVKG